MTSGRLRGRCVFADGTPAAGARVRVDSHDVMSRWRGATAAADDDGRFEIRDLPADWVDVWAAHERASSAVQSVDARADAEVELVHDADLRIAGHVILGDGTPIRNASVSASGIAKIGGPRLGYRQARIDAVGHFALSGFWPGTWRLLVVSDPPGQYRFRSFHVEAGNVDARLTFPVPRVLTGRVTFGDGTWPASYAVNTDSATRAFAGTGGRFTLEVTEVPESIFISGPFVWEEVASPLHDIGGRIDLGEIVVDRGRTVTGRVLAPDGSPVAGARVSTEALKTSHALDGTKPVTDADGTFRIPHISRFEPLGIAADHPDLGRSLVDVRPAGDDDLEVVLRLVPVARLEVMATRAGKPHEISIHVTDDKDELELGRGKTRPDGVALLDRLVGRDVIVRVGGAAVFAHDVLIEPCLVVAARIAPGETTRLTVEVPSGRTVSVGFVKSPPVAVRIALEGERARRSLVWRDSHPPSDGRVLLRDVVPGVYTLVLRDDDDCERFLREITVGDEDVTVDVELV